MAKDMSTAKQIKLARPFLEQYRSSLGPDLHLTQTLAWDLREIINPGGDTTEFIDAIAAKRHEFELVGLYYMAEQNAPKDHWKLRLAEAYGARAQWLPEFAGLEEKFWKQHGIQAPQHQKAEPNAPQS